MEQHSRVRRATYGLVAVAGAVGLVSAAYGGRVLVWAVIGLVWAVIGGAYLAARRVRPSPTESPGLMFTEFRPDLETTGTTAQTITRLFSHVFGLQRNPRRP